MHKYNVRIMNVGGLGLMTRTIDWEDVERTSDLDLPAFAQSINGGFLEDTRGSRPRWIMPASILWIERRG
jgi:hypothetical protein